MKVLYKNKEVERICSSISEATKYFGGDKALAKNLIIRINYLVQFPVINDLIQANFGFHNLKNKLGRNLEGYFAINVKTKVQPWRIIIEPLDNHDNPYKVCHIDKIKNEVKTIRIVEVSKHYE